MEEEETNSNGGAPASTTTEDHDRELRDVRQKNTEREKFHENLAEGQWRTLADLLANPPPPPGDGTQNNGSVLMAEVGGRPPPPPPSQSALTKDVVTRFVRVHGATTVGSGPFLRGFRVLLETQRGKTTTVAWRLKSAVLTQSGGEEWMRDAVSLLSTSCHRRIDCEGEGVGGAGGGEGSDAKDGGEISKNKNKDDDEKGGEPVMTVGEWLAWSLPVTLSDGDITKILDVLPSHAALEDNGNPTGVVLLDAHRKEDPPREAYWYGGGRRGRESCFCFLPVPLFFVVATLCCIVVMVR